MLGIPLMQVRSAGSFFITEIGLLGLTARTGRYFQLIKPVMVAEGIELLYALDPEPCLGITFRIELYELDTLIRYCCKE